MSAAFSSSPNDACEWRALDRFPDLTRLHRANPERYPHLLESVAHGGHQARYDILFAFPGDVLTLHADGRLTRADRPLAATDFLSAFDAQWETLSPVPSNTSELPFRGGWFVFLSYELASTVEPTVTGIVFETGLPVASATRCPAAVIRDHDLRKTFAVCEATYAADWLPLLVHDIESADVETSSPQLTLDGTDEEPPERFLDGVGRALDYIRAGDVFQVNLSRLWRARLSVPIRPVELYRRLRAANPAPFAGLMTLSEYSAVVSSSPERLVSVHAGQISTRPIAGTYPRSLDPEQDRAWSRELLRHPKERAEHVMLLDLERNDLGRVCRAGTVRVSEMMTLESYRHVHHIVSEVRGELRAEATPGAVLRAVFPGGTITGCPKVRCMQIIAELEQAARGAYSGSFGYINRDGDMDFNILIRSIRQHGRNLSLRAGSGIVADSDPTRELNETRAKAKGMLAALGLN